jgi:Na+-transporting NADH:ubiquinone oxidoreductase subunit B
MNIVIMALVPCLIFGMFNAGYQHHLALGEIEKASGFLGASFWTFDNLVIGLWQVLPLVIVSYGVGLVVEFIFAVIKGHEVEEGYLVTGMLVPLIVPVDTPLWMLAVAVIFGVVIGKEVFGGTGMNILNPALTIRAFLFFAYPTWMSGDKVWVHGAVARDQAIAAGENLDAISGETLLGYYAKSGQELTIAGSNGSADIITTYGDRASELYSIWDMFWGIIPGSVGETSKFLIIIGALFLIFTKIGSWRIILSTLIGALTMGLIFNGVVDAGWIGESSKFYGLMNVPFWQHLIIGSILFGAVYMATDPVTASQTNRGKWIYGFLIGFISIMIRVFNPAYPEGVFLAILLMNVFAPTIDHYVVQGNVKKRLKRLKLKTA